MLLIQMVYFSDTDNQNQHARGFLLEKPPTSEFKEGHENPVISSLTDF